MPPRLWLVSPQLGPLLHCRLCGLLSAERCRCAHRPAVTSNTVLLVLPGGAELKPRGGEQVPPLVRRPPRPATPGRPDRRRRSDIAELGEVWGGRELRLERAPADGRRLTAAGFDTPLAASEGAALPDENGNDGEEDINLWRPSPERPQRPSPHSCPLGSVTGSPLSPLSPGHVTVSDGSGSSDSDNWGEPLLSDDERPSPEPEQPVMEGPFRRPMLRPPTDMGSYSPCAYRAPLADRGRPTPAAAAEPYRPLSPPEESEAPRREQEAASVLVAMACGGEAADRPRVRHNAEPGLLTLPQPGAPAMAAAVRRNSHPGTAAAGTSGSDGTSSGAAGANRRGSDGSVRPRALLSRPSPTPPPPELPDPAEAARIRRIQQEQQKKRSRKQQLVERYNAQLWADCTPEERGAGKRQREEGLSPAPRPLQQARCGPCSPEGAAAGPGREPEEVADRVKRALEREGAGERGDGRQETGGSGSTNGGQHDAPSGAVEAGVGGCRGGTGQVATELDLLTLSDREHLSSGEPVGQ